MKKVKIEITKKMCDELNELHKKLFGDIDLETKKALGINTEENPYKPHTREAWTG